MSVCKDPIKEIKRKEKISKFQKNRPKSSEHKIKIGLGNKGKLKNRSRPDISNRMKGNKISKIPKTEEWKNNISKNHADFSGDKNPNWKGGISYNDEYCPIFSDYEFKKMIKERDNNMCLNPYCNQKKNTMLHIHHINYNKKDCNTNNLITLCISCNSKANFKREWHKDWYSTIIEHRYKFHIRR